MKNFVDELTAYRVKVERDGKELVNMPGILALPGLLIAPKMSIAGMVIAPLLGCSLHLENEEGKGVDIGKAVKKAADTLAGTAEKAVKTVSDEVKNAWDTLSADDPEECAPGEENEEEPAGESGAVEDIPTVEVNPDDSEKE